MKKYTSIIIFVLLVISAFAIEEAIKDTVWFKNIVDMLKLFFSNLTFFVLLGGIVYFLFRFQKLFDKYLLKQKELFSMFKFLNDKIENSNQNTANSIFYLDKGNETIITAINESIKSFKLEITDFNNKTGDYNAVIKFSELKIGSEKDPRIQNPSNENEFIRLEQKFHEILKRYEHNSDNK